MKVIINGEEKDVQEKNTILDIINEYKINPDSIIVEYNLNVLDKKEYNNTYVNEGDNIEIVKFMGGG